MGSTAVGKKHRFDLRDFEVKPESSINLAKWSTKAGKELLAKDVADEALAADVAALQAAQERLYASNRFGLLVILQGMDASGKDGAIGHVMRGVNPLGCRAYAFKAPNELELKHHFLWRPMAYLPERGMISLFNRSYYEEVLVVRVHPKFLEPQRLPQLSESKRSDQKPSESKPGESKHSETKSSESKRKKGQAKALDKLWKQRYREINAFERSLASNGTLVIKFFLHVSPEEQKQRLLERMQQPEKHWKFNPRDLEERKLWPEYKQAFESALAETSTTWAPWYVIPADNKWYARAAIADIIAAKLEQLDLNYPEVSDEQRALYQQ
ncbi:MAG: polyphosphate kinase 2 family protein [Pirellulaceae bacterium]|nr:polyphosphate kinase 2 family protein [Pirellulaceae bacterium]